MQGFIYQEGEASLEFFGIQSQGLKILRQGVKTGFPEKVPGGKGW